MENIGKRLIGTFFFGIFLAGGLYMGFAVATQLPQAINAGDWSTVDGTVVKSDLRRRASKSTRHSLIYSYQVDGHYLDGNRVAFMDGLFYARPETMAGKYPKGKLVTVYFSPDNPAVSVLETGVWWVGFVTATIASFIFLAIGLLGIRVTFR